LIESPHRAQRRLLGGGFDLVEPSLNSSNALRNDVEMERARQAVARLEKEILKEDSTLNTTAVWDETARLQPSRIYEHQCKPSYDYLITTAPGLPAVKDFG
jgi:hypothetical protein